MKYAAYDSTTGAVEAWYDFDFTSYPNLDVSTLIEVPDDVWATRLENRLMVVNGAIVPYVAPTQDQAELVAGVKAALAAFRYEREVAGVPFQASGQTVPSIVASDRDSQSKLIAAYVLSSSGRWRDGLAWKMADGSFIPLNSADAVGMSLTVQGYVSECFDHESDLASQIDATTDSASLSAIDITVGWPLNTIPVVHSADTTETTSSSDQTDASNDPTPPASSS